MALRRHVSIIMTSDVNVRKLCKQTHVKRVPLMNIKQFVNRVNKPSLDHRACLLLATSVFSPVLRERLPTLGLYTELVIMCACMIYSPPNDSAASDISCMMVTVPSYRLHDLLLT
jgi:hypothetical protein